MANEEQTEKQRLNHSVTFRVNEQQRATLARMAEAAGVSQSKMARRLLEESLDAVARSVAQGEHRRKARDDQFREWVAEFIDALNEDSLQVQKAGINFNQLVKLERVKASDDGVSFYDMHKSLSEHNKLLTEISRQMTYLGFIK